MIAELFKIIFPVFACAGIGYAWAKLNRPFDTNLVSNLVTNVGAPALILSTLADVELDPAAFGTMALAALVALVVFLGVSYLILKMAGMSQRVFLPAMSFPNCGNLGLPLCLFAFGEKGLGFGIAYFVVWASAQFTVGAAIAAGTASYKRLFRMPLLYTVAFALVIMATDTEYPAWFGNTVRLLGGLTIPLMLIALGYSVASLHAKNFGRGFFVSVMRLGLGFALSAALAQVFGFEGVERGVFILQSAMPVAVFNYLFAQQYDSEPEEVAGTVVISTALSFVTLPVLLWYLL